MAHDSQSKSACQSRDSHRTHRAARAQSSSQFARAYQHLFLAYSLFEFHIQRQFVILSEDFASRTAKQNRSRRIPTQTEYLVLGTTPSLPSFFQSSAQTTHPEKSS